MIDLNNFQWITLSQFSDWIKFHPGSGSGYHLVIDYYKVMFYMLMMLMKYSFVPQYFFRFFFLQDQDQDFTIKINNRSYVLCSKDTNQISCRSAKFSSKLKSCLGSGSGSGSWLYFGFQYQIYISYIEDTHQILFGSANSFESYCVHSQDSRTYRQTTGQTDRRKFFFCLFCFLRHTKHELPSKGENFFFIHAITILSLFTYFVCDEKVKNK